MLRELDDGRKCRIPRLADHLFPTKLAVGGPRNAVVSKECRAVENYDYLVHAVIDDGGTKDAPVHINAIVIPALRDMADILDLLSTVDRPDESLPLKQGSDIARSSRKHCKESEHSRCLAPQIPGFNSYAADRLASLTAIYSCLCVSIIFSHKGTKTRRWSAGGCGG